MRTARRISQILFLLLFLWLIWRAAFPYKGIPPSDLFLRLDPLVALITMLAARAWIGTLLLGFAVLAATIALGRLFCGWLCPLGTTLDLFHTVWPLSRSKGKGDRSRRWRWVKFALVVAILVAALLGLQLLWPFDPIVLMTRTVGTGLYPLFTFCVSQALAVAERVPFLESLVVKALMTLQRLLFPLSQPRFHLAELFLLVFVAILLLEMANRRFWCRSLCPLGALLGVFSQWRVLHREVEATCTECGLCKRRCRMDAVEDDYVTSSTVECIGCGECVAVCPAGSIHYRLRRPARSGAVDLDRRRFLGASVAGLAVVGVWGTGFSDRARLGTAIRPPGAVPEPQFLDLCVRCQACVKACSTTGGCLQPSLWEAGLSGLWTPIAKPREGYCEYTCTLCGEVCPTGAIHRLPLEAKQHTRMGTAFFDKSRCIPWYRGEDCLVCEEHCPVPDKAIRFDVRAVRRPDGTEATVKLPYVVEELCIGCGICVTKCPVVGTAGIFVTNAGEQRWDETTSGPVLGGLGVPRGHKKKLA